MNSSNQPNTSHIKPQQEFVGTLTAKGGVTIPVEVRRVLKVKPKDKVVFRLKDNNAIELASGPLSLDEVMGSITPLQPDKSLKQVRDEVVEAHAEKVIQEMNA